MDEKKRRGDWLGPDDHEPPPETVQEAWPSFEESILEGEEEGCDSA